jgi:hypothetical protein
MAISEFLPGAVAADPYAVGGGFGSSLFESSASKPQYILKIQPEGGGEAGAEGTEGTNASLMGTDNSVAFQSMLEMSASESSSLPEEPIEQGSFASYNRTIEPITMTCRLALQGKPAEIQDVITRLQELKKGTEKLTFILPMASYENMMLESFDYRRDDHSGHNVLIVDVRLKEIREIEDQKTTSSVTEPEPPPVTEESAADGSCCSEVDCGEVQGQSPSGYETASASDEAAGDDGRRSSVLHDIFGKI